MAAYKAPKPTPLKVPTAKPGKPKPQPATTVHNGKSTQDNPKQRWPGLRNAGQNANPNKPGAKFDPGKAKAVASAKTHAAADTSTTDWLAPVSSADLAKQAKVTISAAYKPSFGDLNSEQKQLAAINAKRAQDNAVYQNWASGQENSILAQGAASDANFTAAVGSANAALAGAAPASAALVAQANARQGNVSDNATSSQLGAGGTVDQNTGRVNATNDISTAENLGDVKNSGDLLRSDVVNANSRIGDNEAGQAATAQQQFTDIATQRSKLQLSKAGDIEKEIARLQGVEIQKAQNNQQQALANAEFGNTVSVDKATAANNAASIKAGLSEALLKNKQFNATLAEQQWADTLSAKKDLSIAKIEQQTQLSQDQIENALNDAKFREQVKTDGWAQAATVWKQQHPNAGKQPAHAGNPGNSPLTANEQNEQFADIQKLAGQISGLWTNYYSKIKGGDTTLYQDIAEGKPIQVADVNGKPHTISIGQVSPAILNAAFSLSSARAGKGGLTPKEIAKLRAIGLRNVTQHLS